MSMPLDISETDQSILAHIAPYTMTSVERQLALIEAVRYLIHRRVPGCFAECGVWRGGSVMAAMLAMLHAGVSNRNFYLYDTFEGMTPPTEEDKTFDGVTASTHLQNDVHRTGHNWCVAGIDDVRTNVSATGYTAEKIHFSQGAVEETLPVQAPAEEIALLRLDTDWYQSTKHELIHLFPKLSPGGVLIVDDYGHWQGAKQAVDEYMAGLAETYFMHRIDYTGRLIIKA